MKDKLIKSIEYIFENTERIHGNSEAIDWQKLAIYKSVDYILTIIKDDIDLAYCAGIFNVAGIDALGKELERLKHIDRKPHEIFQLYKPEIEKL